jgi:hypothetical protein
MLAYVELDQTRPGVIVRQSLIMHPAAISLLQDEDASDLVPKLIEQLLIPVRSTCDALDLPRDLHIDLVVHTSEAWSANDRIGNGRLENPLPASQRPDRRECIAVMVHGLEFTAIGSCPIVDKPPRRCEFAPLDLSNTIIGGRYRLPGLHQQAL